MPIIYCDFKNTSQQTYKDLHHNVDEDIKNAIKSQNEVEIDPNIGMYIS